MLVTALSPHIGYDRPSAIAHKAYDEGTTLCEAPLSMGVSAAEFDLIHLRPGDHGRPPAALPRRKVSGQGGGVMATAKPPSTHHLDAQQLRRAVVQSAVLAISCLAGAAST
jgi:hypothetical protein